MAVGAANVLGAMALALWGAAAWVSWAGECPTPGSSSGGLGRSISAWPPAAQCLDRGGAPYWHQGLPWASWAIVVLVACAAAILLAGLIAAIRELRRPAPAASARSIELLEASVAAGLAGWAREPSERAEGDPPAMAA